MPQPWHFCHTQFGTAALIINPFRHEPETLAQWNMVGAGAWSQPLGNNLFAENGFCFSGCQPIVRRRVTVAALAWCSLGDANHPAVVARVRNRSGMRWSIRRCR